MNILEELDELFDLAERDEQWHIRNAIIEIRKAHARRIDPDPNHLAELQAEYQQYVEDGIPQEMWPARVNMYRAYEVFGNVMGSGGDMPEPNRPIRLKAPEDWGIADVYPLAGVEVEDV